jgi:thioredoxin 1
VNIPSRGLLRASLIPMLLTRGQKPLVTVPNVRIGVVKSICEQFILRKNEERLYRRRIVVIEVITRMSGKPVHVSDSTFKDMVAKHSLVMIDFWADWCGPCRALAPTIEELASQYAGRIVVGKLDVDENPATAERFGVCSIPTVVMMKNGKEVERVVGCVPKDCIETIMKKHME